jgi:hypothetical protein
MARSHWVLLDALLWEGAMPPTVALLWEGAMPPTVARMARSRGHTQAMLWERSTLWERSILWERAMPATEPTPINHRSATVFGQ